MTTGAKFNPNKKYGLVAIMKGMSSVPKYVQDGKYFNLQGNEVLRDGTLVGQKAEPVEETYSYDTDSIASLEDFDGFVDFLNDIPATPAKGMLKDFAESRLQVELKGNRKLAELAEEARAEFKAHLEEELI